MAKSSSVYYPATLELKLQALRDMELCARDRGVPVPPLAPGGQWDLLTTTLANQSSVVLEKVQTLDEDANPLTATGDQLNEALERFRLPLGTPDAASGKVRVNVTGVGNVPVGMEFQAIGVKGKISRTYADVYGAVDCDARMSSTGPTGNLPANTVVRFSNQPANIATEAVVIADFVGGTDEETEQRKKDRLSVALSAPGGGGNWGQFYKVAMETTLGISHVACYPALGGPSSLVVALCSNTTPGTREVSEQIVRQVAARYAEEFPAEQVKIKVVSSLNRFTDIAIGLRLPVTGSGCWLGTGPDTIAQFTSVGATCSMGQVGGTTPPKLEPGDQIAVYNSQTERISTATVVTANVGATETSFTVDVWTGGYIPIVGDWIFPAFEDMEQIIGELVKILRNMGPGEMILSDDPRFKISHRHPDVTQQSPNELSSGQTGTLASQFKNIIAATYIFANPGPTTNPPATVQGRPEIICLRRLGVYPI